MKSLVVWFSLLVSISGLPLEPKPLHEEGWLQICCEENDRNEDGAISFREFTPFILNIFDLNRKELERIFLTADQDKNSDLDGSECPIVRQLLRDLMKKKIDDFKAKYDVNGDGNVDQDEVRSMAMNEFGVSASDADLVFSRTHNSHGGQVEHSEWIDLLLELRRKSVKDMGSKFSKWDRSNIKQEKLTYGELKRFDPSIVVPTLKMNFKKVDYDKDFYLSPVEYMALVHELKDERDADPIMNRAAYYSTMSPKRFKREDDTAPPEDASTELPLDVAEKLSENSKFNMAGGKRGPSMDFDAVTISFDDPDFE